MVNVLQCKQMMDRRDHNKKKTLPALFNDRRNSATRMIELHTLTQIKNNYFHIEFFAFLIQTQI